MGRTVPPYVLLEVSDVEPIASQCRYLCMSLSVDFEGDGADGHEMSLFCLLLLRAHHHTATTSTMMCRKGSWKFIQEHNYFYTVSYICEPRRQNLRTFENLLSVDYEWCIIGRDPSTFQHKNVFYILKTINRSSPIFL